MAKTEQNTEAMGKKVMRAARNYFHQEKGDANMKGISELKQGDCTVITDHGNYSGSYSEEHGCVFFAIPAHYRILGYIQ